MEVWVLLVALLVSLLTLQYLKKLWDRTRYPPGPFPLPIIGGIWRIGTGIHHDTLIKMAKQYGNIYSLWAGPQFLVGISGFQSVKEALVNRSQDFSERPATPYHIALLGGKPLGIVFSNGHMWEQQRRFAAVTMGKKGLDHQIEEEAHQLVETFARKQGKPFDPFQLITNSVCNVICALVFGHGFDPEDKTFQNIREIIDLAMNFVGTTFHLLYDACPWFMKYLPGPHQTIISSVQKILRSFIQKEIDEHKEHQTLHDPQDFIDFYLVQIEKKKNDPNSTYDEENLFSCILDLFVAGTETVATTLQWALFLLANYPDIQEKVHKEIEDVFGSSRLIHYQDHKKLPYTTAVIHEVQRLHFILMTGIPRQCSKDVTIHGFLIPKGTLVVPDLRSVLHDPERWETPEKFNPNHFLDKEGHFVAREEFMPFGAGSRVCLGEQMARIELFIFITNLVRAFRFQPPEGVKKLKEEPCSGLAIHPRPYKICAIPY